MVTAQESADCMCECVRLAALTDDPQHREQRSDTGTGILLII
jgi:hypothetical protein